MKFRNLTLVGTSHIAKQSLKEVESAINEDNPKLVAVELDMGRLHSLFNNDQRRIPLSMIKRIGVKGYVFSLIGAYAQRKLGGIVGVSPGSDMKKAVLMAREKKIKVALIDQDIEITLRKFSKRLTWKEKFRFVGDIFRSIFFRKREIKKLGVEKMDLSKVPSNELIKKLTEQLRQRYPNIYSVLIEERNHIMANNLFKLMEMLIKQDSELEKDREDGKPEDPSRIVAVVGAGHEEEILQILRAKYSKASHKNAKPI